MAEGIDRFRSLIIGHPIETQTSQSSRIDNQFHSRFRPNFDACGNVARGKREIAPSVHLGVVASIPQNRRIGFIFFEAVGPRFIILRSPSEAGASL
jgi:hypothetical protein